MSTESGPDWVRDALHQTRDEIAAFLRTARDVTLHPSRFAAEWAAGGRRALNPLGFLATAFAVVGPTDALARHFLHVEESLGFFESLVGALLPFVYYLLLGAFQHVVLRLCGSRRALRDTCAMALYAGGGPATAAHFFVMLVALARYLVTGTLFDGPGTWIIIVGLTVSFTMFCTTLGFAVGGLNRGVLKYHHVLLANLVAISMAGLLFALIDPPGNFGLHMVLGPAHDAKHGWHFVFDLAD